MNENTGVDGNDGIACWRQECAGDDNTDGFNFAYPECILNFEGTPKKENGRVMVSVQVMTMHMVSISAILNVRKGTIIV
jgi:hypothetical protein